MEQQTRITWDGWCYHGRDSGLGLHRMDGAGVRVGTGECRGKEQDGRRGFDPQNLGAKERLDRSMCTFRKRTRVEFCLRKRQLFHRNTSDALTIDGLIEESNGNMTKPSMP